MKITIDKIMSFGPCEDWPRERILEVTGGREEFDTSELAWFEVPTEDLIWLTEQILKSLGNRDEYMLSAAFTERVLPLYDREYPGDPSPRQAIRAARLYALGEMDESELAVTSAAAIDAASDYVRLSAMDAAWAAAWGAAWAAYNAASAVELQAQREICEFFLRSI